MITLSNTLCLMLREARGAKPPRLPAGQAGPALEGKHLLMTRLQATLLCRRVMLEQFAVLA